MEGQQVHKFWRKQITSYQLYSCLRERNSLYHSLGTSIFEFIPAMLTFDNGQINRALGALKTCISICNQHRRNLTLVESLGNIIKKVHFEFLRFRHWQWNYFITVWRDDGTNKGPWTLICFKNKFTRFWVWTNSYIANVYLVFITNKRWSHIVVYIQPLILSENRNISTFFPRFQYFFCHEDILVFTTGLVLRI